MLLELGMTNALRPSELFALKWQCFSYETLTITLSETVYKGKIRPWGKTPKSMGEIHITQELSESLLLWKQQCPNLTPCAFIFSNSRESFIDADRFRKPLLRKLRR
jgi:integrase